MVRACALLGSVLVVLTGCAEPFTTIPYRHRVAGSFVSEGGELGDFTLIPRRCSARDLTVVDLTDGAGGPIVRLANELVADPAGGPPIAQLALRVARTDAPGGPRELVFLESECEVLSAYAHWTNRDGAVEIDCRTPEGGRFHGYATFAGCP